MNSMSDKSTKVQNKDNEQIEKSEEQRFYPEKTLLTWDAPSRPFKKRDRQFWVTIVVVFTIAGLILFLVEGVIPVILVISLVFLFYILTTVEPETISYKISSKGIRISGDLTKWNDLIRFWFTKRLDNTLLILETVAVPGRLELVIDEKVKDSIKKQMSKYLPEEESSPAIFDKLTNLISKILPTK